MDPEFNKKLLKEVRKYECIYDVSVPEYRNTSFKKTIWKKIAEHLSTREAWCRIRWKSLRDTYKRKKRAEHLSAKCEKPFKKFKFNEEMSFLDNTPSKRNEDENGDDNCFNDTESSWPPLPSPKHTPADALQNDEASMSSSCKTTPKITEHKSSFTEVLAKSSTNNNDVPIADPLIVKNSTLLLFESLAHKIISAGLSESDVDTIELKVSAIVYEEVSKARQKWQSNV